MIYIYINSLNIDNRFRFRIRTLPESFGSLIIGCNLSLYRNQLTSLPESFGSIKIRGDLNLVSNKIKTLPESFRNIDVGGKLDLSDNPIINNGFIFHIFINKYNKSKK